MSGSSTPLAMLENTTASARNDSNVERSGDPFQSAIKVARRTFEMIEEYKTPPVPRAYEVFFEALAGEAGDLKSQLDETIRVKGALDLSDIDRIYDAHFGPERALSQKQDQTADDLEQELGAVLDMVSKHLTSNRRYESVLGDASADLSANITPAILRRTLEALIAENQRAREEATDLSRALEASRDTLQTMKVNLNQAREEGLLDPLTGLRNRRYLDSQLMSEIEQAEREHQPLCVCMLDLDHFKRINDTFGHLVGDAVLKLMSAMINDNIKGRDIAARYGGEEFALVLPQTSLKDAAQLADKIRMQLSEKRLVMTENRTAIGQVTVSIGVAQLRRGEEKDALIGRADGKLYEAKRTGRNKVLADGHG